MSEAAEFTLTLGKEDFKFSAAHFTLFADGKGELLHGHNYRMTVELRGPALDGMGLLADIAAVKDRIRAVCARLDEHTLIPEQSELLDLRHEGDSVEVRFGERAYRLPQDDVTLLPLINVTIELLARMLWDELAPTLDGSDLRALAVAVEETAGQRCRYEAPLPGTRA